MSSQTLLGLHNVSVTLQGIRALRDVSLSIRQGEHCALLGPNGAGKSTLCRIMRAECFPAPGQGHILWYPHGTAESSPLAGREECALVSIAHTELYLRQQWLITGEELILSGVYDSPLLYAAVAEKERAVAVQLAAELDLTDLLHAHVATLSPMRISMLLFARACIRRPRLLLLDEFIDGLDARYRTALLGKLTEIAKESTLIFATHRPENLPPFVRRVIRMEEGRITAVEDLARVRRNEDAEAAPYAMQRDGEEKHAVFSLQNVSVYIDGAPVLRSINWEVREGEHWALAGGPGSGKSTLMRLLAGDHYPACGGGIARILPGAGETLNTLSDIRRHIRLVSGDMQAHYAYNLLGEEFVCSGRAGSIGIYHEPDEAERTEARTCLEQVDALHLAERPIRSLSTGQLRRLFLARALVGAPEVLLLDDPFAGLDAGSRARIRDVLHNLVESRGIQTIMTAPSLGDFLPQTAYLARLTEGRLESGALSSPNSPPLAQSVAGR
ncbi:MAG: ATP-binding cassette domain-containing protein [Deltaproteobacteria bacterium]|nr:ATP-binding cassette domain-containing protein [Deltaproteobacteria bacterium]